MSFHKGWIGVDLDGTLAHYDGWKGIEHVGDPVPEMLRRVKAWLAAGQEVRIFTARVAPSSCREGNVGLESVQFPIYRWCEKHLGRRLVVTHEKDMGMVELWDDRAVQIVPNTGKRADGRD